VIVDIGSLRFEVPDGAIDHSTYVFARGPHEQLIIERYEVSAQAEPRALLEDRIEQVRASLSELRGASMTSSMAPCSVGTWPAMLGKLDVHLDANVVEQRLLFMRVSPQRIVCVRHLAPSNSPSLASIFSTVLDSIRATSAPLLQPPPPGWIERVIGELTFALPRDFAPPRSFAFSWPQCTLALAESTYDLFRWYFRSDDEMEARSRMTTVAEVGPAKRQLAETWSKVSRKREPVASEHRILIDGVDDEHVVREISIASETTPPLRVFAAGPITSASQVEAVWKSVLLSIDRAEDHHGV
jgi:hypothetical protein